MATTMQLLAVSLDRDERGAQIGHSLELIPFINVLLAHEIVENDTKPLTICRT